MTETMNDPTNPETETEQVRTVPLTRFQEVIAEKNQMKSDLEAMKASLNELQTAQKAKEDSEAAERGEFEKLANERKAEIEALQSSLRRQAIERAVSKVASGLNFNDTDDAIRNIDLSQIEVSASGEPDTKAIEKLVKSLAETKPYLIKQDTPLEQDRILNQLSEGEAERDKQWMKNLLSPQSSGEVFGGGGVIFPQQDK